MMSTVFLQAPARGGFLSWLRPESALGQTLLMVGAFLFVGLVFFIWAAFWRKPSGQAHHHSHDMDAGGGGLPKPRKRRSALSRAFGRKRHRRSRSRQSEERINPTLAQSGGLPPRRDDQSPQN